MLYVIAVTRGRENRERADITRYSLYDTITDSVCYASRYNMYKILSDERLEVKNANLRVDSSNRNFKAIMLKDWPHELADVYGTRKDRGSNYVLLNRKEDGGAKLVNCFGIIETVDESRFYNLVQREEIANCSDDVNGKYTVTEHDTYIENSRNTSLEAEIAAKYKLFVLKSRALGLDISFKYEIDGDRVKIVDYTGTSKTVIIPNFITDITRASFDGCEIERLTLNNGLKSIGVKAFDNNNIQELEIPDTVEIVGTCAFTNNSLTDSDGNFKKDRVSLLGNTTIVLNQAAVRIMTLPKFHGKQK